MCFNRGCAMGLKNTVDVNTDFHIARRGLDVSIKVAIETPNWPTLNIIEC